MTRQILAFLALLSGLAALSGPAHASVTSAVSCDIGVSTSVREDKAGTPAEIREATKKRPARCPSAKAPKKMPLPRALRKPVLMGIERSFE